MKNNRQFLSIHMLLKTETSKIHNEIEKINILNKINPTIENYITYIKIIYSIIIPINKKIYNFNEWNEFFPNRKNNISSNKLLLDLKNLEVDFNNIKFSKYIPEINSFEQALGCFYVLEGSSLGGFLLCNKLSVIHGESLRNKMNYLNGSGNDTFQNWKYFIDSLEEYNKIFPENKNSILTSAINTFQCFKSEFILENIN